ncbi:hypothetical protein J3E69DRAFT_344301 [Trichoderma sp. SZMC 28015]
MQLSVTLLGLFASLAAASAVPTPQDPTSGVGSGIQAVCFMQCALWYSWCRTDPHNYRCGRDGGFVYDKRNTGCEEACGCLCDAGCKDHLCEAPSESD